MNIVLRAESIRKYYSAWTGIFRRGSAIVKAVDGIDIVLEQGKVLGMVGESGCGKSTLARVLMRLEEPTSGKIYIDGEDFLALKGKELRKARRKIQMIFQDPYSSLNPRLTVGGTIAEGIKIHKLAKGKEVRERVRTLLAKVGLPSSAENKFPHEFSGGQRQRIGIARTLAVEPEIIIADEPVSSLDVSVRAQIINLLKDIQEETGVSVLFIAHDLGIVKNVSDKIAVMYLGKIVELSETDVIFSEPLHPYTKGLLASIPVADPDAPMVKAAIKGDVPSPINVPSGCPFHPRCPEVMERCIKDPPRLVEVGAGRLVRCWLYEE